MWPPRIAATKGASGGAHTGQMTPHLKENEYEGKWHWGSVVTAEAMATNRVRAAHRVSRFTHSLTPCPCCCYAWCSCCLPPPFWPLLTRPASRPGVQSPPPPLGGAEDTLSVSWCLGPVCLEII